jgi:hypothetical protein
MLRSQAQTRTRCVHTHRRAAPRRARGASQPARAAPPRHARSVEITGIGRRQQRTGSIGCTVHGAWGIGYTRTAGPRCGTAPNISSLAGEVTGRSLLPAIAC